jgi:hypothetical protein
MSGYGFEWKPFGPNRWDLVHPFAHSAAKVVREHDGRISAWVDEEFIGVGFATFDNAKDAAWEYITGDAE